MKMSIDFKDISDFAYN